MDFADWEILRTIGAFLRFVIFYPFKRKSLAYYLGDDSKMNSFYNWVVTILFLIVLILGIKFLV